MYPSSGPGRVRVRGRVHSCMGYFYVGAKAHHLAHLRLVCMHACVGKEGGQVSKERSRIALNTFEDVQTGCTQCWEYRSSVYHEGVPQKQRDINATQHANKQALHLYTKFSYIHTYIHTYIYTFICKYICIYTHIRDTYTNTVCVLSLIHI